MTSASIVVVDVNPREAKLGRDGFAFVHVKPFAEELSDILVARGRIKDAVCAIPHPENSQCVAMNRRHAFRQDIEPCLVVRKAPDLQDVQHIPVGDLPTGLQLPSRHLVGNDPCSLDVRALRVALLARLFVYLVEVHAVLLGKVGELLPQSRVNLDAAAIRTSKLGQDLDYGILAWRAHAGWPVCHGPAQHFQVASLVLPEQVCRLAVPERLAHGLGLLVLLVPVKGLAPTRLRVGDVADARPRHES
mmetsp:Transcript_34509/g.99027  ORF Transcript_34509/g.99027 Transcript_34509/m.99027 type:complete len:247 (+) Transcript_34509:575-1315(+)